MQKTQEATEKWCCEWRGGRERRTQKRCGQQVPQIAGHQNMAKTTEVPGPFTETEQLGEGMPASHIRRNKNTRDAKKKVHGRCQDVALVGCSSIREIIWMALNREEWRKIVTTSTSTWQSSKVHLKLGAA